MHWYVPPVCLQTLCYANLKIGNNIQQGTENVSPSVMKEAGLFLRLPFSSLSSYRARARQDTNGSMPHTGTYVYNLVS